MSVVTKLKKESMKLRKERSPVASSIVFAISEIEKVGKNNGNRETTNDEAIKVVQKIIATIDDNLKHADDGRKIHLNYEKNILQSVLPQMVTDEEVIAFLKSKYVFAHAADDMPRKGDIMKELRGNFGALVDMKRAGQIVSEMYGV